MENLETLASAVSRTLFQLEVPYDAIRIDAQDGSVVINGVPAQAPRAALDHAFRQARLRVDTRPAGPGFQIRVHPTQG
ncbi:hypothetical protein [Catenulispora pinisilvae]|uniref:hypothetical protein n=1 Tax=Catenulispora pinisilvae TaxID=2705253 RepID=UPI001890E456|nr:hypothetical protein [Catenulispora pinisilvae]